MFAPKTTASSRFNLHSALRLRNALHFYPHIGIKSHAHAAAFYDFNRFPKNNREKLVVPRRRYVHILGHIAEANVTFRGKGGTAERVTDFVFKIGTKRSLFRRRRGDPMWSPVYIPQYKKRKKHRLRVTPSFAWAQFVHSALFFRSPAVARTARSQTQMQ